MNHRELEENFSVAGLVESAGASLQHFAERDRRRVRDTVDD